MEIHEEKEINDVFPEDHLYNIREIKEVETPWFVDFVNYLVGKVVPSKLSNQQKKKFFTDLKYYV